MKFNGNKDKTVDAIGPVKVMKAAARTVLEYPNFKFSLLDSDVEAKNHQATISGTKRNDIEKQIGIIEKKVSIPSLLVPQEAYKRGVMVSLPKGQHAFLKCADKKSPEKKKSKGKSNTGFIIDENRKDPNPISMNALKPGEGDESSEENKKLVGDDAKKEQEKKEKEEKEKKEEEDKKKEKEQKEKEEKEKEEKEKKEKEKKEKEEKEKEEKEKEEKEKEEKEKEEKEKEEKEKEEKDTSEKGKGEEKTAEDQNGGKNSATEEEAAFSTNFGNTEFELKLPDNEEAFTEEKSRKDNNITVDSGEKKHSTSTQASSNPTMQTKTQAKPESFSQGYSDAKVFEKALTEDSDKPGTEDALKKQLLSLFDKDMMVSLYKMAIKDLMSELGLRTSKSESVMNIRGRINGLKNQQVQLEQHFPGITRSLVAYNKYFPEIQKYLDKLDYAGKDSKKSMIGKRSKAIGSEIKKLIEELKRRSMEDEKSYYESNEASDGPSYDDCVDDNCRNEKQLIKTAHEYFGNLDALAMKPYEKFYKSEDTPSNHVHKGIKRSSKKVIESKDRNDDDNDESITLRDSLFKALTDASGVDNPEAIVQLAGKLPKVPVRITLNPRGPLAKLHRPIQIDLRPSSESDATSEIVARTSPGVSVSVPKGIYQDLESERKATSDDAYADMKRSRVPRMLSKRRKKRLRKRKRGFRRWMKKRNHGQSARHLKRYHRILKKKHHNTAKFPIIKETTMSAGLNSPEEFPDNGINVPVQSEDKSEISQKKDPYTEIGMCSIPLTNHCSTQSFKCIVAILGLVL